jgi:hypothetical protein
MLRTELIDLIKFKTSKRGQKMAFYWSNGVGLGGRWIRLKMDLAEHLIATEQAEEFQD